MTVDRDQIRQQLEGWLAGDEFLLPNPRDLARQCLALLAELEQAEKDLGEEPCNVCSGCGRKVWGVLNPEIRCGFEYPNGSVCVGWFNRFPFARLAKVPALVEALREIATKQPEMLETLRRHGVVFDSPLGNDPSNWQHVAFTIYTQLCETESIARPALTEWDSDTP